MSRRNADRLLGWILRAGGAICGLIVVLVAGFVLLEAWPALRDVGIGRFFGDPSWHPTEGRFNLVPMIGGSLAVTAGSVLVTVPLGIACAVFARFYAPPIVVGPFRQALHLLAGVPSVVYGLWALTAVVPIIAAVSPAGQGRTLLAGIVVLSLMTLPIIAVTAEAALAAVPTDTLRAAAALGLSRRAIACRVAIPAARAGIATGAILQTGRAVGETMAVLMVCGNIARLPGSLFDPVRTLTANIALEMGYATDDHRATLFVSGLLLMAVVAGLVLVAELVDRARVRVA